MNNLIGILSDTHDQIDNLRTVLDYFKHNKVQCVIHCGDWISPFTLHIYTSLGVPIYGVFGNNDGDRLQHIKFSTELNLDMHIERECIKINKFDRVLAVYHGTSLEITYALEHCGKYDAVFWGHTHKPHLSRVGNTLSFNPGSLMDYTSSTISGASFGLYDPTENEAKLFLLSDIR